MRGTDSHQRDKHVKGINCLLRMHVTGNEKVLYASPSCRTRDQTVGAEMLLQGQIYVEQRTCYQTRYTSIENLGLVLMDATTSQQ